MLRLGKVIAAGTRSTVYICGPDLVAKVPLPTTPDSWIRYEAAYTAAVRGIGAPAPVVADVVEIDGRAVGLYERIDGPSMWEQICAEPQTAGEMGRLLADIHERILTLVGPLTVPRQYDRLVGKIRRAASLTDPQLMSALALIPTAPLGNRLCHGDLHPGNVLMSADGPVVIDWFDACRGVMIGDVARSSLLIGAGGATLNSIPHLRGAPGEVLAHLHDAYLDEMIRRLGFDRNEFELWQRIEAAARLSEGLPSAELVAVWQPLATSSTDVNAPI